MRRLFLMTTMVLTPLTAYAKEGQKAEGLRDIKGPFSLPAPLWPKLLLVAVFLAAVAAGIYYFWRRRQARPQTDIPASQRALQQLTALQVEKGDSLEEIRRRFVRLDEILRRYVEERFSIRAPEMTTPEFLQFLRTTPALRETDQSALRKFLPISELVKFARHQPAPEEVKEGFDAVQSFIEKTKEPDGEQ